MFFAPWMHSGRQPPVGGPDAGQVVQRGNFRSLEAMMAKRSSMSMQRSRKMFRKGASRVQSVNFAGMPMRGGIRM